MMLRRAGVARGAKARKGVVRMARFTFLAAVAAAAVGCASVDPDAVAYGARQRAGLSSHTYAPALVNTDQPATYAARGWLGFSPASGIEVFYNLPLARGFALRLSLDSTSWDAVFDSTWPADERATWSMTTFMVLLEDGARWGRFGLHCRAGFGYQTGELDWPGHTTTVSGSVPLEVDFGSTTIVTPEVEIGLDLCYRSNMAGYERDSSSYPQVLHCLIVRLSVGVLF
jgi:hypothetical protein